MNKSDKKEAWVKIPNAQASHEEWAGFFNSLGRPGEAAAYELTAAELEFYDASLVEDFKNIAHKAGLNQKQAQIVHDEMVKVLSEKYARAEKACAHHKQDITEKLRQKWGGDYEQNLKNAQQGAKQFGLAPEDVDVLENLMGSEAILEAFMRMGTAFKKDTSLMEAQLQPTALSAQTARQRRAELSRDEGFLAALMDKSHPSHQEAVAELNRLNQVIVS